jgi:hypothetical protein
MTARSRYALIVLLSLASYADTRGDEPKPYNGPGCTAAVDDFFLDEVWAKVVAQSCLNCHKAGGDAEQSKLLLRDPQRAIGDQERQAAWRHNRDALARIAQLKEGDRSRLLVKVTGGLDHGGADILPADSAGYRILETFVRRTSSQGASQVIESATKGEAADFFAGVAMLDDRRLLRRATLSLAGRLPNAAELAEVQQQGRAAFPAILDNVMREEAFYERLREGFNDIFLTLGVDGNAEASVLSYEHFSTTRLWYQKHDLSRIADEKERRQAGYKLAADYRQALLGEPMKLIEHIVRNDHPFTEIVTADYIMVTPYQPVEITADF